MAVFALLAVLVTARAGAAGSPPRLPPRVDALFELRHPQGLAGLVREVSNPRSPRYRHYLGVSRVIRRFGASPSMRHKTVRWLSARGLHPRVGPTRTYVAARMSGVRAKRLLRPSAHDAYARERPQGPRALGYQARVPRGLRHLVSGVSVLSAAPGAVSDGASFAPASSDADAIPPLPPAHGSERDRTGTPAGCAAGRSAGFAAPDSAFTPNQYLTAYGHARLHSRGLRGRAERVSFVEIDGFRRSDIEAFGACFGIQTPPIHVHPVAGPVLSPGDETTLDLEVFSAAVPKVASMDVYEGSSSALGILETSAAALGSRHRRPDVISISLEGCEPRYDGGRAYLHAYTNVFAVAAAAGISTLVAAGDQGSSMCTQGQTALPLLATSLPATSPYVTAVGGTNLVLGADNHIVRELVWNDAPQGFGAGGGGYSLVFGKPWWQHVASTDDARGVPDLAALADPIPGFAIFCTASACASAPQQTPGWIAVGGTSAATPLVAGGVALADQAARRRGQSPLGFLNPMLYGIARSGSRATVFRDLRHGDNDLGTLIPAAAGGGEPLGCCSAKRGYDLVSGWGSPNLAGLNDAALKAGRRR
jgi:subtilase family serine protease